MGKFLAVASFHNNPDEHIDLTFQNVLKQTHKDWILIVADDHSDDEEFKRRLKHKVEDLNDSRIIYYQTDNRRELYLYQNTFQYLDYDYYFDLDSDDILHEELFEIYDRHFIENPDISSIFCDFLQYKDGELEQWSLVEPAIDYKEEWKLRNEGAFWDIYAKRNTQKMFGVARAMRKPISKSLPIEKNCKTATDTYFLFYNLTRGKHLHIPRNLYTYHRRSGSDSQQLSEEEYANFNLNARPFIERYTYRPYQPHVADRQYDDVWHLTSAIQVCEWLDEVDSFSLWTEQDVTAAQKKKIRALYPYKTISFNTHHNNLILAWQNPVVEKINLGDYQRLSVLSFNDATGDKVTEKELQDYNFEVKSKVDKLAGADTNWYFFFRQARFTHVKEESKLLPKCRFYHRSGPELHCDWVPEGVDFVAEFWLGGKLKWKQKIFTGFWGRYSEDWFQNWECRIIQVGHDVPVLTLKPDLKEFGVKLDSNSLGDTLSWVGQIEELKQQRDFDKIYVKCFKQFLFNTHYYKSIGIHFVPMDGYFPDNFQNVGVYQKEENTSPRDKHPRDWRTIPLGAIAADQLGIGYRETKPKLAKDLLKPYPGVEQKSVCIATESTAAAKYWNREGGWQTLIDKFNSNGWKVYYVSKEPPKYTGVHHVPDLTEAAQVIKTVNKFIGISSGLSWLAWALGVDVCMISGFTWEFVEFKCDVRIINHNVCAGCWSFTTFDRGDWNWCPLHKGTDKQFECTKTISPEYVWQELETAGWFNI